jgi:5-methylcytosine-specific restriction endonuclease McrA
MRSNKRVLVLNQSYQPIALTTVKKAIILTWRDKVETVEIADFVLHSPRFEVQVPLVVRLKSPIKYNPFKSVELNRKNIFKRDGGVCFYCGSPDNLTIDHVVPRSRGGKSTWDNLVTACHPCNNKKDNKTPDQVGFKTPSKLKAPTQLMFMSQDSRMHEKWKPYLYMV